MSYVTGRGLGTDRTMNRDDVLHDVVTSLRGVLHSGTPGERLEACRQLTRIFVLSNNEREE